MRDNSANLLKRIDAIIEEISLHGKIGGVDLAKRVGLPRSTVYRLLADLESVGYIKHDPETPQYQLSIRLFELGSRMAKGLHWRSEARPVLEELARITNETAHLAILDGCEVVYVDFVGGAQSIGLFSRVGKRAPLYCTATGKVLLANLPSDQCRELMSSIKFKRYTETTICSPADLEAELEAIRHQGFATNIGEQEEYLRAIAAAVRDHNGGVVCAISMAGPSMRLDYQTLHQLAPQVCEAAANISARLGYSALTTGFSTANRTVP